MQWGAWAAIGMVASNTTVQRAMHRSGVGMLQPRQGLAAMRQLLGSAAAPPQLAAIPFVWSRFMLAARNASAFLYGEHLQHASGSSVLPLPEPAQQQQRSAAAAVSSEAELLEQILSAVAAVHGSAIEPQQPLLQAGLDSLGKGVWLCYVGRLVPVVCGNAQYICPQCLTCCNCPALAPIWTAGAVELRNSLQRTLGVQLPGTLVFDYPTAASIAAHCHQLLAASAAQRQSHGSAAAATAAPSLDDMLAAVAAAVQTVAGAADLAPDMPLLAAGLDSLSAVELRDELQRSLGLRLPGTLVFDYPTPASLAAFLQQQAAKAAGAGSIQAGWSASSAIQPGSGAAIAGSARPAVVVTINATASRLSAPSISSTADSCRLTPYSRWDVDGSARHGVPHRPGSRFAR